jgi:hypothetical protein
MPIDNDDPLGLRSVRPEKLENADPLGLYRQSLLQRVTNMLNPAWMKPLNEQVVKAVEPLKKNPIFKKLTEDVPQSGVDVGLVMPPKKAIEEVPSILKGARNLVKRLASGTPEEIKTPKKPVTFIGMQENVRGKPPPSQNAIAKSAESDTVAPPKQSLLRDTTGSITFDEGLFKNYDYVKDFVNELSGKERIQPPYEKGTKILPKRIKPMIPEIVPQTPWRDLRRGATVQSPHNIFARIFSLRDNPVIDMFEGSQTFISNHVRMKQWSKDVLSDIPDATKEVTRRLKPLFARHQNTITEVNRLNDTIAHLESTINKIPNKMDPQVSRLNHELADAKDALKRMSIPLKRLSDEHSIISSSLAHDNPGVRVYMAAADELPIGIRLTRAEQKASKSIRDYMTSTRDALKSVGIPIINEKAYMPRIWSHLLDSPEAQNVFAKATQAQQIPGLLPFMSRTPGARSWFPSVHAAMDAYIPTAEFKIAYQPFLKRWSQYINTIQQPRLREYMQNWVTKNLYAPKQSVWESGLNGAVGFEYARLIGLSLSTGVKHLTKLANTFATYGTEPFAKGIYSMAKIPVKTYMNNLGLRGRPAELQAVRVFVNGQSLSRYLDELPRLSKTMNNLQRFIGNPVTAIEAFDNGVSVLAGIVKAGRQNMPIDRAMRAITETILSSNFRSGGDQPLWQKNPIIRGFTMFQSTPFKLTEFKINMIRDALKWKRDAFGTLGGTKLVRYALAIGLAETTARHFGTSLIEGFLHLPFVRGEFEAKSGFPYIQPHVPKYSGSPLIDIGYELSKKGLTVPKPEEAFGLTNKIYRSIKGDIPDKYSSTARYLFGFPTIEDANDVNDNDDPLGLRR